MKIRKFEKRDFQSLIEYNNKVFIDRDKIEESILYRFFYNPISNEPSSEILIAEDDNDAIIGQILMMPSEFSYKGNFLPAFWGMDYFVNTEHRNSLAGLNLANKAKNIKHHFGVAFTKKSSKIFRLFKEMNAGNLDVYIRPNSIMPFFRFLFPEKQDKNILSNFPHQIKSEGGIFQRIFEPEDIVSVDGWWNHELIEFTRNKRYLLWRFFFYPDKYIVYKYFPKFKEIPVLPIYFVVRPVVWKKMNCLLLVDYRFDVEKKNSFRKILTAAGKLTKKLKLAATITGCSLPSCRILLNCKLYFRIGEKREILTNFNLNNKEFDNKSDEIFVTFADSDSDFYYGNERW